MLLNQHKAAYLAIFLAKEHTPQLNEDGKPDCMVIEWEDEFTGHNGYRCMVCEFAECMWCSKEIPVCH